MTQLISVPTLAHTELQLQSKPYQCGIGWRWKDVGCSYDELTQRLEVRIEEWSTDNLIADVVRSNTDIIVVFKDEVLSNKCSKTIHISSVLPDIVATDIVL